MHIMECVHRFALLADLHLSDLQPIMRCSGRFRWHIGQTKNLPGSAVNEFAPPP